MRHILFVCTGNTCRSPMAEGILNSLAEREGLNIEVKSAGVAAIDGLPVSNYSLAVLKEKGIAKEMVSSALKQELIDWADVILTMTAGHKSSVATRFPQAVEKTFTLKEFVDEDPEARKRLEELFSFQAELEMKRASSQTITEEDLRKLAELQNRLPNYDINDPFGGSMEEYRKCSEEIEACLEKLISKIKGGIEKNEEK